ncbi:MAG: deoxyribodipyrimidine photo-lyase, partial [Cyanobacteria bacterium J06642_11]
MRILLWFRNDLRLHDHEPLHRALEQKAEIIPVYCFDPRQFGQTSFGFAKTGAYRAQFLLESVADLRSSFQAKGADLIVRHGQPEAEIPAIAQALNVDAVYWHEEVTSEELAVDAALAKQLTQLKIGYEVYWGATLYHPDDLPFEVSQLPKVFTSFRKKVEKSSSVYPAFPSPKQLPPLPKIDRGELPTLGDFGLEVKTPDSRGVMPFKGGETEALQRLQHYFWDVDKLRVYKQTRNGMLGA